MQIYNAGQPDVIPVGLAQPIGDFAQNVCVGLVGIVEARRVDKKDLGLCIVGTFVDADSACTW